MFGDLLKNLLQKQVQSSIQDRLGGTGASILGGLFGGDFGNLLGADKNPLQDIFGDKWQQGGGDMFNRYKDFRVQQPLHQRFKNQNQYGNFNFQDILKNLI